MQNIAFGFDHGALKKTVKHGLIYSSFRENIIHGLILHLGKSLS